MYCISKNSYGCCVWTWTASLFYDDENTRSSFVFSITHSPHLPFQSGHKSQVWQHCRKGPSTQTLGPKYDASDSHLMRKKRWWVGSWLLCTPFYFRASDWSGFFYLWWTLSCPHTVYTIHTKDTRPQWFYGQILPNIPILWQYFQRLKKEAALPNWF